ncbi:MAG: cobyrinate a,c-diamide synthase, partial [bacterium]
MPDNKPGGRNNSPNKGLVVAGTASRTGKTTVTLAALRAMARRGIRLSSAKIGPDFIDPEFHRAATGKRSVNLDGYAMGEDTLSRLLFSLSRDADFTLIEGVMGLFDGSVSGAGSTADIAQRFKLPVVLVVDVSGQSASVGAVVKGFRDFRPDVKVAAVILNRVANERHEKMCRDALPEQECPVVSALPHEPSLVKEHRHLGLKQAEEIPELEQMLERAADWFEAHTDWELFLSLFAPMDITKEENQREWGISPFGSHIAVASDVAFRFFYPHLALAWRSRGARISCFSPLADEAPPADADAIYLPGGYPELHAQKISGNKNFLNALREASGRSVKIYGECGGYMVLGESLRDASGTSYPMAGLLPVKTSIHEPKRQLGYREAVLHNDALCEKAGCRFRAHEFHYASIESAQPYSNSLRPLFETQDAAGASLGSI